MEIYTVSAGTRSFVVVALNFKKAMYAVFTELNAKTSADLPKAFDMRQVDFTGTIVYDGEPGDFRQVGTEPRVFHAKRIADAEQSAAEAWAAAGAASRLNERLIAADKVITELDVMSGMIALHLKTLAQPLFETLREYKNLKV